MRSSLTLQHPESCRPSPLYETLNMTAPVSTWRIRGGAQRWGRGAGTMAQRVTFANGRRSIKTHHLQNAE